jgi:hypothetical protein
MENSVLGLGARTMPLGIAMNYMKNIFRFSTDCTSLVR